MFPPKQHSDNQRLLASSPRERVLLIKITKGIRATMTIKIEREALLCVLTQPPCPDDGDEYVNVSCGKDRESPCFFVGDKGESSDLVEKLRRPIRCESFDSLDDDTVTTASCSSASSLGEDKRVSFAQELVTEVWERPRTPPEDVPDLFFSASETTRYVLST